MDRPPDTDTFAGIVTALAALVSAAAWPALVGTVLFFAARHVDRIAAGVNRLMEGRLVEGARSARLTTGSAGPRSVETIAAAAAALVIEAARKSPAGAPSPSEASAIARDAQALAGSLASTMFDLGKRLKILWVDDHPEHNVDLQLAFQALGMVVVCVDSNEALDQAFEDARGFDAVITDMGRGEVVGRRLPEPEGGLRTVSIVAEISPGTAVVIYAGSWAAAHLRDAPRAPVVRITNYPPDVFATVTELATQKAA